MPEASYTTTARLPVETVWSFVEDMDNWAEFVAGYQSHEKEGEHDSRWVLKGDVGVLSRILEFRAPVAGWSGPSRVAFELVGLNEPMQGGGHFEMEPVAAGEGDAGAAAPAPRRGNFVQRALEAIVRLVLRLFRGRAERAEGPAPAAEDLANRIMARLEEIHGLKA